MDYNKVELSKYKLLLKEILDVAILREQLTLLKEIDSMVISAPKPLPKDKGK